MRSGPFVFGTRGSELALAQTDLAAAGLKIAHPELEIRQEVIQTTGDLRLDVSLQEAGKLAKGLFTKELDVALAAGRTHASVHSLKDLPTERPEGFRLAATLPREDWRDVMISKTSGSWQGLAGGAVVGTGSPRRAMQLTQLRSDLRFVPVRGNVPTRVRKLAEGVEGMDAIVLAAAGLKRLGLWPGGSRESELDGLELNLLEEVLPAPGQAAVAVEALDQNAALIQSLNHASTATCTALERRLLQALGGGCHLALGSLVEEREGRFYLRAVYRRNEGQPVRSTEINFLSAEADAAMEEVKERLEANL